MFSLFSLGGEEGGFVSKLLEYPRVSPLGVQEHIMVMVGRDCARLADRDGKSGFIWGYLCCVVGQLPIKTTVPSILCIARVHTVLMVVWGKWRPLLGP